MRVVFIASECVPFSKTGGLADVVGALPPALSAQGHQVEVFVPRYRMTKPGRPLPEASSVTIPLGPRFKFASIQDGGKAKGVSYYLVEMPEYFDRDGLYQTKDGQDYPDNPERFSAFCLATLEYLKRSATPPDVLHCHDWQTSLAPVYWRTFYRDDPCLKNASVVLTIHNLGYPGLFPPDVLPAIGIPQSLFNMDHLEFFDKVNLLKGGIVFADFITTVSRKYAEEIKTKEFGFGLEGVLEKRGNRLQGILNGVDYEAWDPANDKLIAKTYSPLDLSGKTACKKALLEKMSAKNPRLDRPVIGIVSRFATQKGFDLIAGIAEQLMVMDLYIAALGTGEPKYEALFRSLAERFPDHFLVKVAYDNELAHQIEAGADIFLMPSRYEPCGLNQIYSLKYGTVPVVRATGGLDDTIQNFNGVSGTGFKFQDYSAVELLDTLRRALKTYHEPAAWRRLMLEGMSKDYSWASSAAEYARIYQRLRQERSRTLAAS
ncbi:MAG: glycogen synthase GlgA [Terriglobia bacterium]